MVIAALTALNVAGIVWLFALGCAIGSFLNVLIWRLPRGMTMGQPRRSFCPRCGKPIRWHDNIPLASFIILGGRCRDCGGRISWRYPIVEALTGMLFALIYVRQGIQAGSGAGQLAIMMLVACLLIVAGAVDMDWLIIPDEISFFGLAGGLIAGLLLPQLQVGPAPYHTFRALTGHPHLDGLIASAIGAVGGGVMVLAIALFGMFIFRREAMGLGDVKLMAMVGAFFGWKVVLVAFVLSPFIGLLYGIPLLVTKGEHVMPYGPFLSIGAVLALLFRTELCAAMVTYLEPLAYVARLVF